MNSHIKRVIKPFALAAGNAALMAGFDARTPDGRWYKVSPDFDGAHYLAMWMGYYERAETKILRENFDRDHTIIEIGANIGVLSRIAHETKLTDGGRLVCIEPNPSSLETLKANIRRASNFGANAMNVIAAAIGSPKDEGKTLPFHAKPNLGSGLASVTLHEDFDKVVNVPVKSLSSIVGDFAEDGYSLICDAEGAETLILKDDADALKTCRQIVIELHGPEKTGLPDTPEEMVSMLEKLGFHRQRQLGDTHYFNRHIS